MEMIYNEKSGRKILTKCTLLSSVNLFPWFIEKLSIFATTGKDPKGRLLTM